MAIVKDSFGTVELADEALWGINTQRSLMNFKIGSEIMPEALIKALLMIKRSAAHVNGEMGLLAKDKAEAVVLICTELLDHFDRRHYPLSVWQTGSGTQTNMNVNEVIVGQGAKMGYKLHPNDDVNCSQSSNDVMPSAIHIMTLTLLEDHLFPALENLKQAFAGLEVEHAAVLKIGRTHLQDAVPMSFGQEVSAYRAMLATNMEQLRNSAEGLRALALGGTAVGTGLNSREGFDRLVCTDLSAVCHTKFHSAENKFQQLSAKDAVLFTHGGLNTLAANLLKIANDIRWLASGPRAGLGEIELPANEAGSSIMPGKVNPTQCEALTMVCAQVFGNQTTMTFAASQGNFQLNVYMPLIAYNLCQSVTLLSDAMQSFTDHCIRGLKVNKDKMAYNLNYSLMSATILNRRLGYDMVSQVVKQAYQENMSLKAVVVSRGLMSEAEFDAVFDLSAMIHPASGEQ